MEAITSNDAPGRQLSRPASPAPAANGWIGLVARSPNRSGASTLPREPSTSGQTRAPFGKQLRRATLPVTLSTPSDLPSAPNIYAQTPGSTFPSTALTSSFFNSAPKRTASAPSLPHHQQGQAPRLPSLVKGRESRRADPSFPHNHGAARGKSVRAADTSRTPRGHFTDTSRTPLRVPAPPGHDNGWPLIGHHPQDRSPAPFQNRQSLRQSSVHSPMYSPRDSYWRHNSSSHDLSPANQIKRKPSASLKPRLIVNRHLIPLTAIAPAPRQTHPRGQAHRLRTLIEARGRSRFRRHGRRRQDPASEDSVPAFRDAH